MIALVMKTLSQRLCLLLVISLVFADEHGSNSCSHTEDLDGTRHVHIFPRNGDRSDSRRSKRDVSSFTEKFTMKIEYDSTVASGLSLSIRQRIQNNVMPKLKEFLESVLTVRPLPGPIILNRQCSGSESYYTLGGNQYCESLCETTSHCGTAIIPSSYLNRCRECNDNQVFTAADCSEYGQDGEGVDSSFVLYVSAVTMQSCPNTPDSGSTLAFAGSCEMEDDYDRPIAGYVNFCPQSIDDSQTDEYLLTVAKHEVLHALGFSSGLYGWWRDENGDPRSPRDANGDPETTSSNTLKVVTYTDWDTVNGDVTHTVSLLVTPNIMEEGRRHFNCSTLEGVQLEDQGGSGTINSHWEARITKGEVMNGVITNDAVFSRFTFALLEDSGWYKVNYSFAEQLVWGRGSGCELPAGSCGGYIASQQQKSESISPFCDYTNNLYRCTVPRTAVSDCNLGSFTSALPAEYQYFSANTAGGTFQSADFCPFQVAFSNTRCDDTSNSQNGLNNSLAQTFGPNSRCVEHGTEWRAQQGNTFTQQSFVRAGCYNYACSNGQVTIQVLDQSYVCTTTGQEISIDQTSNGVAYTGSIICPSCLEICYDDFDNCPEAADVYSEFATGQSPIVPTDTTTGETNVTTPSSSSSTPSGSTTPSPSGALPQAVSCLVISIICIVSIFVFSN